MKRTILFLVLSSFSSVAVLTAQEKTGNPEKLGTVQFPISCTPAAQQQFDRALAMLHSFWYPQGLNAFAEVTKTDPSCAMGYWGIAISRRANPLVGAPDPPVLKDGLEAVEKAKAIGGKTQRERDYITAIEAYYKDWEKLDYRTRVLAYEKAMEQVYLRYPGDREAAIFYALAMNEAVTALKEFEVSLQAARNRYRGFYGAAKAAERSGDRQKARAFYEKLVALCSHADTERPELTEAKAFLAKK